MQDSSVPFVAPKAVLPRWAVGAERAGLALLALVTGLYVMELLYHGALSVAYPYDLNYGEGYVLNDALRLARGELPWTDVSQFPMVRSPYPPLFLLAAGALSLPDPSFFAPRLLSLGAALAIGIMLAGHARAESGSLGAWLAGGLWFGSTFVYQWAPLARVDMVGLALSLAAVVLLHRRVSTARLASAALLCSAALLTKQTLLAAPAAIVLLLALQHDRRAVGFAGGVFAIVGGATVVLSTATGGQYAEHVLLGNAANPFRLDRALEMGALFIGINAIAAAAALWVVATQWRRLRPGLVGVYVALGLVTTLAAGNISSDVNYFLEPTVALALAAPIAWQSALRQGRRGGVLAWGLALVQLALLVHIPNGFMSQIPPGPAKGVTPVQEDVRVGDRVAAIVREAGARALVEPAGIAVVAGAPVWIQPVDLQAEQQRGRWSSATLNDTIREHRWAVVVLTYKFLPADVMATLDEEYVLTDGLPSPNGFSYFVYRPRPIMSS